MKTCKRCGESKELSEFYKHSRMADGHLSFCRSCTIKRIKTERRANPEKHSERERARYVGDRRDKMLADAAERAKKTPEKRTAHYAVNNAVRDGRLLKPSACSRCGREGVRLEGHHDDYSKPLDVVWMCCRCHRRHHADNPHLPA
jgi:hypothetical protein